ncbi:MAG: bifunctional nuclease family protein [Ignavibacteriaceae bacterium]|nr:bifunctional nuclease family protein [Ignavibacteriaceae bacterium]
MSKIECEILALSSNPTSSGAYALVLKEVFGNRRLPIIIGHFEAQAIALELEGIHPPRPLTHDLIKNLIENLGGTVMEVEISELRDNTFYARIILEVSSLTNEVDARPSDAIAIALRTGAPIYVAEQVLSMAGFVSSSDTDESLGFDNEITEKTEPELPKGKESKLAALQSKLREAIDTEDYERAAKIRDEIQRLTNSN